MSRVAPVSSEEIERLSNGFGKIPRTDCRMMNVSGSGSASKKGYDEMGELREDEIWGDVEAPSLEQKHSRKEGFQLAGSHHSKEGSGGGIAGPISKMKISLLSMELKASGRNGIIAGVGFAAVESLENGYGGGFSTRKVNISGRVDGVQGVEEEGGGAYVVPQSVPVSVPMWMKRSQSCELMAFEKRSTMMKTATASREEDEDNGGESWIPPHEIVARNQTMTSSVCEGAGRTLKGMDMRRVRNAVWSRIGFMD